MAEKADAEVPRGDSRVSLLIDDDGEPTTDPGKAARGELVSYDRDGRARRTWFWFEEVEIKWLPVSESAFLLWVLALLFGAWLLIGLVLGIV